MAAAGRLFRSPPRGGAPPGDCPRQLLLVAPSEPHRGLVPWPHAADCGRAPGRASADEALLGLRARGVGLTALLPAGGGASAGVAPYAKRLAAVFVAAAGGGGGGEGGRAALVSAAAVRASGGSAGVALVSPTWPAAAAAWRERHSGGGGARAGRRAATSATPADSAASSAPPRPPPAGPPPVWRGTVCMAAGLAARVGVAGGGGGGGGTSAVGLFDASLIPSSNPASPAWPPGTASSGAMVVLRLLDARAALTAVGRAAGAGARGALALDSPAATHPPLGAALLDWLAGDSGGGGKVVALAALPPHLIMLAGARDRRDRPAAFVLGEEVAARLMGGGRV